MITVLVVAPTARARTGLAAQLGRHRTIQTLVASPDLPLAEQIDAVRPDVLLAETTPDAALAALALPADPPAVVLVASDAHGLLESGRLRDGIAGVVPPHATSDELRATVEAAAAGLVVLHRDVARDLRWRAAGGDVVPRVGGEALTPREVEVLEMLAEGLANKAIAVRLGISDHTVKFHVAAILERLGVESRAEAVAVGIRRGLILV